MKILLNFITLFFSIISFGQLTYDRNLISNRTNKVVNKIIQINELMDSAVYSIGTRPKQWDNFEELENIATKSELLELTNHPNGVVRCYAFWALSHRTDIDLFPILKNHLNDYELVNTQFGCIGNQEMVGDFYIQMSEPNEYEPESRSITYKEFSELDSLLIYKPNKLISRYRAIARSEPTEKLYPKIKELVVNEKNPSALVKLAKYKNVQDIEIIKNFKEATKDEENGYFYTYIAISEFPRLEFIPLLESNLRKTLDKTHFSGEWRELYKAIASYKNEKALELLEIPFTKVQHQDIKKYHIDFVFDAILEFQDPLYDKLLWKIWEEENQRTLQSYKYLFSLNPSKAYELTKRELIENYQIQKSDFIPNINNIEDSENFYEYMLNVIIANDKQLSDKIIYYQIETANVHNLPIFTSKVNKQNMFVKAIFNRLENADNPHIYLNLVKTLIEFKSSDINNKILELRKRNKSMNENWGSKALDELFKENDIH